MHLNGVLGGFREVESGGREGWRKEEAVVFGGWTQVEETATTRQRIEKYKEETSSHTQPASVNCTWEARTWARGVTSPFFLKLNVSETATKFIRDLGDQLTF